MPKVDPAAAGQQSEKKPVKYPCVAEMSHEEAAKLVKRTLRETRKEGKKVVVTEKEVSVAPKEILQVNEYEDRYHVITKDGQRLVAEK